MVDAGTQSDLLRWIPLLPLLVATYHGVSIGMLRRPAPPRLAALLSCAAVAVSFLIACVAFRDLLQLPAASRVLVDDVYSWIGAGVGSSAMSADVSFRLDPLSAVMVLIVTFVGSMIHVYSIGYMEDDHRDDRGIQRFFCYLNLFTFSMLVLVLADNLVLMFLGWEGVGLCSYLLIGFWYSDRWNAYCGSKAFIVNRIGDFGFLVGILLLFGALSGAGQPTLSFAGIEQHFDAIAGIAIPVPAWLPFGPEWRVVSLVALCFFVGACGKSAQIPLYVWLPDAMAGPTPVSALIHAATMVTAGVYMVCRMSFLYAATPEVSALVAWTGALTALVAATIAIAQNDIKKVLAYSTVSQLGYMFLAAGCGGYSAAIFHLGTHAFFKALLFLGAGAVILALHHEQDMQKMGGLWRRLHKTRWVLFAGVYAIAGFPPFSGFFSKDEILVAAWASHVPGHDWLYAIGLATAGITAFYMFRLWFLTFAGDCRAPADVRSHIEDPNGFVVNPLWVLAFFSAVAGIAGLPQVWGDLIGIDESNSLANFLTTVLASGAPHAIDHSTELWMAFWAVAVALAGTGLAWLLYVRHPGAPRWLAERLAVIYRTLLNKYYVDEVYDALIVRPLVALSDRVLFRIIDARLIDGVGVNGTARAIRALAADGLKYAQSGLTQSYVLFMIAGAAAVVGYLLR
ncbi:MAG TPA: NADH-quinone oxidoreductase subunit L [Myxococcota bacterium]|nr:NADH-quinone oxidoreductase subunit L [Myxococcota bacterium]